MTVYSTVAIAKVFVTITRAVMATIPSTLLIQRLTCDHLHHTAPNLRDLPNAVHHAW
ncbi:MAG: hypothetical protein F6K09_10350 [Merismopedia sp. SIO2A8]|nr:hypothetical protein [Merismopedia sp. SIO2A8]